MMNSCSIKPDSKVNIGHMCHTPQSCLLASLSLLATSFDQGSTKVPPSSSPVCSKKSSMYPLVVDTELLVVCT